MDNKNIVWFASYPKSGNNWFRAFWTALFSDNHQVDINRLSASYKISDSGFFEFATSLNPSELKYHELENLKSEIMSYLSSTSNEVLPVKIHDKFKLLSDDTPLIPIQNTKVVIYIIRNPLDVAVSYANHDMLSYDRVIERMNENYVLSQLKNKEFFNIPEEIGSWSEHVLSWTQNMPCPVHVMKYEDMLNNQLQTFENAIKACGLYISSYDISSALKNCTFERLKAQEMANSFIEKSSVSKSFFHIGKVGTWSSTLNNTQINQIISDHKEVMRIFGYLDENNNPTY